MPASVIRRHIVEPQSAAFIESDIAGTRLRDLLCEWLQEFASIAASEGVAADGLLIVDGRSWFARSAMAMIVDLIRSANTRLRLLSSMPDARQQVLGCYLTAAEVAGGRASGRELDEIFVETSASAASVRHVHVDGLLVETYEDVAEVERRVLERRAKEAMRAGVRLRAPHTVQIRGKLICGEGVTIDTGVVLDGDVTLGDRVSVGPYCVIRGSRIDAGATIKPFSSIEESVIGAGSTIGPYARIRPESHIGARCQIGNYVEIKKSAIGEDSRINHHTFIGDAQLAEGVTIGAGTITCNHDGTATTQTVIERGAYVGSGCNLVAPIRIGEQATIAAGSTLTRDAAANKLTLARSRQITLDDWRGPRARRDGKA